MEYSRDWHHLFGSIQIVPIHFRIVAVEASIVVRHTRHRKNQSVQAIHLDRNKSVPTHLLLRASITWERRLEVMRRSPLFADCFSPSPRAANHEASPVMLSVLAS